MVQQFQELQTSLPTLDVLTPNMEHCHLEEPIPVLEHLELVDDDSLSEKDTNDLVIEEESQEEAYGGQPL
ncbi:hypothetical protein TIFTF001_038834 [Ficus carica]|uniref:Uncharacterized protein n=1 Tax=Ficus carica TaxID=3494 RepID=A0AA88JEB8_FICCA|nr:hypothetical protein TIFTF001_038834 [Ficus carica]